MSVPDQKAALDPASAPPIGKTDENSQTITGDASKRELSSADASSASELASLTLTLLRSLAHYPDFPAPGVLFADIFPLFRSPSTHTSLLRALTLKTRLFFPASSAPPTIILGLEARGFLFGPSLALALDAGFVPVRKKGKLPGPTISAIYEKEYGGDEFEIQTDSIPKGARVLIVDDVIATGGTAAAAGELVRKVGGEIVGFLFILELAFLKGREKLQGEEVHALLVDDGTKTE